eukprot:scaffold129733_cov69-Phaeocystis_antarctica.AAC.14
MCLRPLLNLHRRRLRRHRHRQCGAMGHGCRHRYRGGVSSFERGGAGGLLAFALSAAFALALALAPHGPRSHQYFEGLVGAHGCHCGVHSVCGALRRSTHRAGWVGSAG